MLRRYPGNPILKPIEEHPWEARCVFNCAAYYHHGVHIVYRGMGLDHRSKLGYAYSRDGYTIDERLHHPIFEPVEEFESRGCEDPRLTQLDDRLYMVYTGYDGKKAHVCMASIKVDDFLSKNWKWERYGDILSPLPIPNKDDKDACLFPEKIGGKYVLIHRIPPDIWIAYSNDLRSWFGHKIIARPRAGLWDEAKIGAAGPPIKTERGWLLIYHGVEWKKDGRFGTYRLGRMILDLDDPERVLFRSKYPILEPELEYEEQGYVANVVFSCGNVIIGDEILVYYGGADMVICVATAKLSDLLSMRE
ncbi:MAG: glycosidase [Candidatus Bathyarchaeia archaeon]